MLGTGRRGSAADMKLFQHKDFEQAVIRAEDHFKKLGLRAAFIEKDYYVTEALRTLAAAAPHKIIFKGGTSLAKGWNLIQRFSEDIDIFLDPRAFDPALNKRAIDRELKTLRDAVTTHPGLTFVQEESKTIGGFGRGDRFAYTPIFGGPGAPANRVLLEAGTASGREPTSVVTLRSYIGQYLEETKASLGADDEGPFTMRLLHFRRTFVEKMFAIHGKVQLLKRDNTPLGTYARHYYDLFQLSQQAEVIAMLKSDEYAAIKKDYDEISRMYFDKSYFPPPDMTFSKSDALFPTGDLTKTITGEYEGQCKLLCYGPYPPWEQVQARFAEIRDLL